MTTYRSFGPLGLIVLAFGLVAGLLSGNWSSLYVLTHLILGGMMVGLYLFTHLDSLQESIGGRQAKYGTNAVVYTLLTLGVLVAINYVAVQNPVRWDVTAQGIFSLAPQSRNLVADLEQPIVARAFYREGESAAAEDLLESYAASSESFTYEVIDPDKRPELAEQYEIAEYGTLHLQVGDESTRLTDVTEESITNALIRMTAARRRVAYYVTGHGEPDLEDTTAEGGFGLAADALSNEGWDVRPLVLGTVPDVPADADLLLIVGPDRAYLERELTVLERYIDRGGKTFVMLDPQTGAEITPLLQRRGIDVGDNVVIERFVQLFAGAQLGVEPVVGDYGAHPITTGFDQRTIFRLARSVSPAEELPEGVDAAPLARTSAGSWAETDLARLFDAGEVELDDEDREGPISLAAAATLTGDTLTWTAPLLPTLEAEAEADADGEGEAAAADEEPPADLEGRLVVFGDSDWVTNRSLSLYYNEDLFLNAVGWLGGEEELISIRPRSTRASRVMLTADQSQAVFYLTVLLLPELILFCGVAIWLGRRYR